MTTATDTPRIDQEALEATLNQAVGYITGAAVAGTMALGDRLGLYRAMADHPGSLTSDELAGTTGTNPRLIREWLDGQTAAGLVTYDPTADAYALPPEAAMVLAAEDSPAFVTAGAEVAGVTFVDLDGLEAAFRSDGAFAWKDHDRSLFSSTGRFFRPGYLSLLTSQWIPSLDGIAARLEAGGSMADVGCGAGHTSVIVAQAFPEATVTSIDYHRESLDLARTNAEEAGVADRVSHVLADVTEYDGSYDLIGFFDCLHDLGDPVAAARHARSHLTENGAVIAVEPFALDDRATNHRHPMAAMAFAASTTLCVPNSLSQPGKRALGAQAGEARVRQVFEEAGFTSFRRVAETPLNAVYDARA